MEEAASSTHYYRASAVMFLGVLSTFGTLEQAWTFPLESPLCKPTIPNKPKHSRVHTRCNKSLQGVDVPVYTGGSATGNGAKAIGDVVPPGSLVPDASHGTRGSISLETLEGGTLKRLLYLFYSLVIAILKRQTSDL